MAYFAWNRIVVPTPWFTYDVPVIQGRNSRKVLIFSSANNGGNWRFDPEPLNASNLANCIINMELIAKTLVLQYRDWGPLVQGPWYADDGGAGPVLTVTEIYQIE